MNDQNPDPNAPTNPAMGGQTTSSTGTMAPNMPPGQEPPVDPNMPMTSPPLNVEGSSVSVPDTMPAGDETPSMTPDVTETTVSMAPESTAPAQPTSSDPTMPAPMGVKPDGTSGQ